MEAAYEYFADAFAAVLPEAVPAGGEVHLLGICYGCRAFFVGCRAFATAKPKPAPQPEP